MGILSDKAGDVGIGLGVQFARSKEQGIKAEDEIFLSAKTFNKAGYVMRHQPCILPGIAFGVVGSLMTGVEALTRTKFSLVVQGAEELQLLVEHLLIAHAALVEVGAILLHAQSSQSFRSRPIGQEILHALADGFPVVVVVGHVAKFLHPMQRTVLLQKALLDGLCSQGGINARNVLQNHICQNGDSGATHHAIGLVVHQMPNWQFALFPIDMEHRLGIVGQLVAHNECGQGVRRAIGVPK